MTNDWFTSTRTLGSFIRGGPCGASAVYSVSLRPACRTPKRVGAGSRPPFELSAGRIGVQSTSSVSLRTNQSFSSANLLSMRRRVSTTWRRCAHNSLTNLASRSRCPHRLHGHQGVLLRYFGISRGHLDRDGLIQPLARSLVGGIYPKRNPRLRQGLVIFWLSLDHLV